MTEPSPGLDVQQLAQRLKGLCERVDEVCLDRADLVVSPYAWPTAGRRYCATHADPFRRNPAYHVAAIRHG